MRNYLFDPNQAWLSMAQCEMQIGGNRAGPLPTNLSEIAQKIDKCRGDKRENAL
jgi:hypothetical protein